MKKVLFISSCGGHLTELLQLKPLFNKYKSYIAVEKAPSNIDLKSKYKNVYYLPRGTKHQPFKYIFVLTAICFKSLYLYLKIRPNVIVTTGAHAAGPMCCIAKIFGSKIIYIETFANMNSKTQTGTLVYLFADTFIVQWENMLKLYPKAKFGGWIF